MKLRIARHTADLPGMVKFYQEVLNMELLGSFEDHQGYHGAFLGYAKESWHLEFTTSAEPPARKEDEDDMIVLYPSSPDEYAGIASKLEEFKIRKQLPKNPYWEQNGIMFLDPEGGRIVVSPLKIKT